MLVGDGTCTKCFGHMTYNRIRPGNQVVKRAKIETQAKYEEPALFIMSF